LPCSILHNQAVYDCLPIHINKLISQINSPISDLQVAGKRFLITVAPQNDICPHGNAYPTNAVAMVKNRINTPTDHVFMKLYDP